ncbi:hypothetical protein QP419_11130, partial [Corynebacterium amycolatum]|uniref:hypothetical protein n=1 Tax=Corynebacterium amycolatum TaxID=43765 RepID=UPI002549E463
LFFGDLWCVVWGYGGMRTHFSLLNPLPAYRRMGTFCYLPELVIAVMLATAGQCELLTAFMTKMARKMA